MARRYSSSLFVSALAMLMAQGSAQSPSIPSSTPTPAKFDVATIHRSPDRSGQSSMWMGIRMTGGTFEVRGLPLKALVGFAYASGGSQRQTISSSGGWIESQPWDIIAKVDDPSFAGLSNSERSNRMRPMVQALLEERFHLKFHTEIRPTPVYVLVQAKGGAKVKEVPAPPAVEGDWMESMKRYRDENPDKPVPGLIMCTGDGCTGTAVSMSAALGQIQGSSHTDRMVIDQTGLKGYYDFSFRMPRNDDDDAMAEIDENLGMKFEPRKLDFTTYVIDSAEKPLDN